MPRRRRQLHRAGNAGKLCPGARSFREFFQVSLLNRIRQPGVISNLGKACNVMIGTNRKKKENRTQRNLEETVACIEHIGRDGEEK